MRNTEISNTNCPEYSLIFDGDCAFCTSWAVRLRTRFVHSPQILTYQEIDLNRYGLSQDDVENSIWLNLDKKQYSGHRAFAKLYQIQPKFRQRFFGFLITLPGINMLSWLGYKMIAKNRHRLPGGTPYCSLSQAERLQQ